MTKSNQSQLLTAAVLFLLIGVAGAASARADEFLFGSSGSYAGQLTVTDSNGAKFAILTHGRQGWWSTVQSHHPYNHNYVVGRCCYGQGYYRDFFTFDLSPLAGDPFAITSAVLSLNSAAGGSSSSGRATQTFALFDVSTDPNSLDYGGGINPAIFADLGDGVSYGSFVEPLTAGVTFNLSLNSSGIGAVQANEGHLFSIGGRLLTVDSTTAAPATAAPATTPEPMSLMLLGTGLSSLIGMVRLRWRKV